MQDCSDGDYEQWRGGPCLLGLNYTLPRRTRASECFSGRNYKRPVTDAAPCPCTAVRSCLELSSSAISQSMHFMNQQTLVPLRGGCAPGLPQKSVGRHESVTRSLQQYTSRCEVLGRRNVRQRWNGCAGGHGVRVRL